MSRLMRVLILLLILSVVAPITFGRDSSAHASGRADLAPVQASGGADVSASRHRLADEFIRSARLFFQGGLPVTGETLKAAESLVRQAIELNPDDETIWRAALEIAIYAEIDNLERQAVRNLARLDPDDDVIALRHVNHRIEELPTVEARIEMYRRLMEPQRRRELSRAVQSRLMLDQALLHRRAGDLERFAEALAEAAALDPGNRAAVMLATGYFQGRVTDPYAESELLISVVLSDPTYWAGQTALAQLLLDYGAYAAAERMYQIALSSRVAGGARTGAPFFADKALAQWAAGRPLQAVRTIRTYQQSVNERYQFEVRRQRPEITIGELGRLTAPFDPLLASVYAAVILRADFQGLDDPAILPRETAVAGALNAYDYAISALRERENQPPGEQGGGQADPDAIRAEIARLLYEKAWIAVWIARNGDAAREALEQAASIRPLSDEAQREYRAWFRLLDGESEEAIAIFSELADERVTARLGQATAALELGRRREAARLLLAVVREQPGTLIGVWANDMLIDLLGQRADVDRTARELNRLVSRISRSYDRLVSNPSSGLEVQTVPTRQTFGMFDPIMVNVVLTNKSPFPLAIDREGPIRTHAAVIVQVRSTLLARVNELRPIIIDLDRRLTLEPRQSISIPVNLRHSELQHYLGLWPLSGANLQVRTIINPVVTGSGVLSPGPLGSERRSRPFRVDGVRITEPWIEQSLQMIQSPTDPYAIERLLILGYLIARTDQPPEEVTGDIQSDLDLPDSPDRTFRQVREMLPVSFSRLSPIDQAYVLARVPQSPRFESIYDTVRQSDNRLAMMMYLMFHIEGPNDPMIEAGIRSEDEDIRNVAAGTVDRLRGLAERQQQQQQQQRQRQQQQQRR